MGQSQKVGQRDRSFLIVPGQKYKLKILPQEGPGPDFDILPQDGSGQTCDSMSCPVPGQNARQKEKKNTIFEEKKLAILTFF